MCMHHDNSHGEPDGRPWWHVRRGVLVAAVAGLLIAGCTMTPQASPDRTIGPLPNESINPLPGARDAVHVTVVVKADRAVNVRWSDGDSIHTEKLSRDDLANGQIARFEFDTTQPYLAVATVTADGPGKLSCQMTATGPANDRNDGAYGRVGNSTETVDNVMCAMHADQSEATPSHGAHTVEIGLSGTDEFTWGGFASQFSSGEDDPHLFTPVVVHQDTGRVRAVVVTNQPKGKAMCRILIDGVERATGTAQGRDGMATCTAIVG